MAIYFEVPTIYYIFTYTGSSYGLSFVPVTYLFFYFYLFFALAHDLLC